LERGEDPFKCSSCGKPLLGNAAVIGLHNDQDWEDISDDLIVHRGSERSFILLNPKCLHDLLDEVMRQEKATALIVHLGPVQDVREALGM
jgi:hypothetical protein